MTRGIDKTAGGQMKDAQCFLQNLMEDHMLREYLMNLNTASSFQEFIAANNLNYEEYELVQLLIEQMMVSFTKSDAPDCSLYDRGMLELL